ncbi:transcription factor Adf-1 [Limanda limanda]|uniref:transcription factor Adf-1 n=1 Tax=Limanda limanda TaxID=27771 RepID=UPI0029C92275|nr:transcription factor Adf-1 [Limanda limanda]
MEETRTKPAATKRNKEGDGGLGGLELEIRLSEQVRLHTHLYDRSMREHRDHFMARKSWREIAQTLGKDEVYCRRLWKNLRDRYVKAKKRVHARSGEGEEEKPSAIVSDLDWLCDFVKHREKDTEDTDTKPCSPAVESPTICSTVEDFSLPITISASSTASCLPPSPSQTASGRKRTHNNESLSLRLKQLQVERVKFMKQYRENQIKQEVQQQDTPHTRFARVLVDMLASVDEAYQQEAMHNLYQVMYEYTTKHPRLPS